MISEDQCLQALRHFIERARRDELEAAQGAIIQFALGYPDVPERSCALDGLRTVLAQSVQPDSLLPLQNAFYTVVDAMIARTKDGLAASPEQASR